MTSKFENFSIQYGTIAPNKVEYLNGKKILKYDPIYDALNGIFNLTTNAYAIKAVQALEF